MKEKLSLNFVNTHKEYIKDVFENFFNDKYTTKEKKSLLSHLAIEGCVDYYIHEYCPTYYNKENNKVRAFSLLYKIEYGFDYIQ